MAIQPQNVPVTLKGVGQKSPSNLSVPGEMVAARNVQILKGGPNGVEFSKRYGTRKSQAATNSPTGITAVNADHLTTLGESLVMDNAQAVFTRDLSQDAWITFDRNGFTFTSRTDVISESLYQKTSACHAYDANSGNEIFAWYDQADRVRFSVRGLSGNWTAHEVVIVNSLAWAATYKVQVFAPGNGYFYLVHPKALGTQIGVTRINVYNPIEPLITYTLDYDGTSRPWDVQMTPEGAFACAFGTVGADTTFVGLWNPSAQIFVGSATLATVASAAPNVSWLSQNPFASGGARRFYLASIDSTNGVRLWTLDNNMAFASVAVADASVSNANVMGYYDTGLAAAQIYTDAISLGVAYNNFIRKAGAVYQRSVNFASKAFLVNGKWHCLVRYGSVIQPVLFLFEIVAKRIVGKVGLGGDMWSSLSTTYGTVTPWVAQVGTQIIVPTLAAHAQIGGSAADPTGTQIQGISVVTFDSAGVTSKPVELGGVLHFPGSIPWVFDGALSVESGFNVFPESVTVTDSGGGGSKVIGGTYGFRATYLWTDAVGNVYESAPSPVVNFTATTAHDLNVSVPTLRLTGRTDVVIQLYGNDPAVPNVFHLINSSATPNVLTADAVTILDSVPDLSLFADLNTRPTLYNGDGGATGPVELEHIPPPSSTIMATAQSRVFVAGIDQDPTAVWVSNEYTPKAGVSYFDGTVLRVTGDVTAIVGRDRNVVIFTKNSIWTVTGEFPDATGGSFAIPVAFKTPHALGAVNANAIVVTSLGIFFQSEKGLHILGWDWSCTYIGGAIEDTLGSSLISSGIEVPGLHQVRLYTETGDTFVWDTLFAAWTTFDGQSARSACNWRDAPCYVDGDGAIHEEVAGTYDDDGGFIQSLLQFAIIAPANLRGYFCLFALQLLGEIKGPHILRASLAYNSQNFATTEYTADQTGLSVYGDLTYGVGVYGGAGDNVLKMEIRPKKRQAAAYQLALWDTLLTSGPSEGFTLQAIVASIGVEGGVARTQAGQRMIKI